MIRKDIHRLSCQLAEKSGFSPELVECYLCNCGKYLGKNPCQFKWDAVPGFVYMVGDPDNYCLGERPVRSFNFNEGADYWEGRILERQEIYMD